MAVVEELFEAHDEVMAGAPSADIFYLVTGAGDEAEVRTAATTGTPTSYNSMPRRSTKIEERVNETTWKIRVHYEPYTSDPPEDLFTFDTTGGTQHITQSIATRGAYAPPGMTPPNFQSAIGFDGERIQGVDIGVPVFSFSETHTFTSSEIDESYKIAVYNLTNCVNNAAFRGLAAGECLFLGASGSQRYGGEWNITYRFAGSPNRANLSVGNITGISKYGWDYLWVLYADALDSGIVVKRPAAVYVEQVYYAGDFSVLGI